MRFSLQCPKKTTCCEQSLENDKKRCLQIPAPTDWQFDVPDEFAPFLLQDSGKDDKERILIIGDATMKNLLNLFLCTILYVFMYCYRKKQKKTLTEWLNCWVKKRTPTLAKYWQTSKKQRWLLLAKNSPTQKSRAVISTWRNLLTGKSKRLNWKLIKKILSNSTWHIECYLLWHNFRPPM